MMRRATKIQLILFVIITLVGVSYVSAEYIGLTRSLFGNSCTVHAHFKDSGGIFSNAEVTYRGVTVGKVGEIHLRDDGIRVDLDLDDCGAAKIPASTDARVANRSVVGEQYVDLTPDTAKGPYLQNNSTIPVSRTAIPTPTNVLLGNLNRLLQSVPLDDLRTTVDELGKAFDGRGNDLGSLLDSTSLLLDAAQRNLPDTIALINNSSTVLQTQLETGNSLRQWTRNLNLLSQQLKASDPDIRRLLDTGPDALSTVQKLIADNRSDLGVVFANLVTVGDIIQTHLDGVEQVFELYPGVAAGGQAGFLRPNPLEPGKVIGGLGLLLQNANDPRQCGDPKQAREGYNGPRRLPNQTAPTPAYLGARCSAPASSGVNVRGSQNIKGAPAPTTYGEGVVYPRPITKDMLQVDTSLQHVKLGDGGWLAILTASLR